jgi:DNA polymerase III sliding clamp (beta) subunit (PCNA family)
MTTQTFALPVDVIKAAMLSASTEETRYYLRGVLVKRAGNVLRIISTDGHRLFCFATDLGPDYTSLRDFEAILPTPDLKRALTGLGKGQHDVELIVTIPSDGGRIKQAILNRVQMEPVDGTFPAIDRVIPAEINGEIAHYNPAYVADIGKQSKFLTGNATAFNLAHNGGNPALVAFGDRDDCFAILMPMRNNGAPRAIDPARVMQIATAAQVSGDPVEKAA